MHPGVKFRVGASPHPRTLEVPTLAWAHLRKYVTTDFSGYMEPPRAAADGQREALMGTPRGPGAVLPAPSAPSGPHIPEAGLGSTLDRGVGAGGGSRGTNDRNFFNCTFHT
jgi:hypothetical protein